MATSDRKWSSAKDNAVIALALLGAFVFTGIVIGVAARRAIALALLILLAANGVGVGLGFLFGIPRSRSENGAARESTKPGVQRSDLLTNTNLEQISDWLTKIIVGLTLVEANRIGELILRLIAAGAASLRASGVTEGEDAIFTSILICGCTIGFAGGYVFTRTFLTTAFQRVEKERAEMYERMSDVRIRADGADRVDESAREAVRTLARVPREAVPDNAEKLAAWAKAQYVEGKMFAALDAYQRARALDPKNAQVLQDYSAVLYNAFDRTPQAARKASALADEARRALTSKSSDDLRRDIYRDLTYYYLVTGEPQRALDIGREYVAAASASQKSAWILVNIACAHGQLASKLVAGSPEFKVHEDEALRLLEQASSSDIRVRSLIGKLLDGSDPSFDDLKPFANNSEFQKLAK